MATTVGPARDQADNSADRCSIAQNVWLPVRRFHVGTSTTMLTPDAGYTTATDSRVDLLPTAFLLCRGRSPYTELGDTRKPWRERLVLNTSSVNHVRHRVIQPRQHDQFHQLLRLKVRGHLFPERVVDSIGVVKLIG